MWPGVAHDFRQSVQAVALLAKVVAAEPAQRDVGHRLGIIALTFDFMIEAMGDIAALEQGTRTTATRALSLQRSATAASAKLAKVAGAAGRTVRHVAGDTAVASDPRLIASIVEALLLHAIKHATDQYIDIAVRRLARHASLDVEYGGADPQSALAKQAFIDLKPVPDAPTEPVLGLGLMLAGRIAHLLGGRIEHTPLRRTGRHRLSLRLPAARS